MTESPVNYIVVGYQVNRRHGMLSGAPYIDVLAEVEQEDGNRQTVLIYTVDPEIRSRTREGVDGWEGEVRGIVEAINKWPRGARGTFRTGRRLPGQLEGK